jgi:hypothetical protein
MTYLLFAVLSGFFSMLQQYKKNRFVRIILKYMQLIIHSERLRNVSYVNRLTT